ncbi:MAG: hypothetical protein WCC87_11420 [Candidatus Korobacteraceae bacterium]
MNAVGYLQANPLASFGDAVGERQHAKMSGLQREFPLCGPETGKKIKVPK